MKIVARTLEALVTSDTMSRILDRSAPVDDLIPSVLSHWSYDLYSRKPAAALLENGALTATDLDLACFLSALVERSAVINLPTYERRRAQTVRAGERVLSADNRHGKVMSLSANKEVFSFSVRIQDMNVIQTDEVMGDSVGAPRNFMLVDIDGSWHDGWSRIQFMPTAKENTFLSDRKLWTDNVVYFKNFVHPNRWISFYGSPYFLTKVLIDRLEEETKFYRAEEKKLLAAGVRWPPRDGANDSGGPKEWPTSTRGDYSTIKVDAFECEADAPFIKFFPALEMSTEAMVANSKRVRELTYTLLPQLRFAARATELAYYKAGAKDHAFPHWIQGAEWDTDYVQKGKRTVWNRLVLKQVYPWQLGFALRYRVYSKTEQVAP